MLSVAKFTFNPFQENTYVVHNGNEAILIDPGCWNAAEEHELETYFDGERTDTRPSCAHPRAHRPCARLCLDTQALRPLARTAPGGPTDL